MPTEPSYNGYISNIEGNAMDYQHSTSNSVFQLAQPSKNTTTYQTPQKNWFFKDGNSDITTTMNQSALKYFSLSIW